MPETLADYPQLHLSLGKETAYLYNRGLRTQRWSYRELAESSFRFARELEARGIQKGERVLLWGENSAEWVAAFFGCMLRGAVAVPMDRISSPDFAQRVAGDVDARLIVCSASLTEHAAGRPFLELETLHEAIAARAAEPYAHENVGRDDMCQIIFTSGTTAEPRGVVLTHRNLLVSVDPIEKEIPRYRHYERLFHPIRFLQLLPLSHVFGQTMGMLIPPLIAGTVLFQESMKPSAVIETIRRNRVSVVVTVPRVLESLKTQIEGRYRSYLQKRWQKGENERFLKRVWMFRRIHGYLGWKFWGLISGGAALDESTEEFWRRLGYGIVQGYGLTETSSLVSLNHPFKVGRRSVGKILAGREMKLDSATGEILVRGDNVARQYWQGKELKPVTGEEGWFHTGDLGELDAEGNLYFKGRSKSVIVTPAGLKIYPEDLEHALRRQPGLKDCVVFAVARGGNSEPCAVLLALDEAAAGRAVKKANEALADFQKIRCWFLWPDEDFPRTSTQKPRLNVLRQFAEQRLGGAKAEVSAGEHGTLQAVLEGVSGRKLKIAPGAHLEDDLALSSLERVELMSALENRYQIDLNDREFSSVNTVSELEKLVRHAQPQQKREEEYPYPRWAQRWPVTWLRTTVFHLITLPYIMVMARPRVSGRENLQDFNGPALIVSNHITQIDIGFILAALPFRVRRRLAAAMQGEMLRAMRHPPKEWFFLRRWWEQLQYALIAALFNVFSLPQRAKYRQSFGFAGQLADRGYNVLIFPEGRRTETGEMSSFRSGIGLLATQLGLPVVPMRIDGLFPLKQQKKHYAPPGTVQVRIGKPIRFQATDDAEEIARRLQEIVQTL